MKIHVLTIFPELINTFKEWSIVGRTVDKDLLSLQAIDIRDFTKISIGK